MRGAMLVLWAALSTPLAAQPLWVGVNGSQAASAVNPEQAPPGSGGVNKPVKKKANRSTKVSTSPGSGETRAERIARLRRECKGMPNAGACSGMTH